MEEKKNEFKVYLFEVTKLRTNDKAEVLEERFTSYKNYLFEGEPPKELVDYGKYWESGDGCIQLVTADRTCIDDDRDTVICNLCDNVNGFTAERVREMFQRLSYDNQYVETELGDTVQTRLRITRLETPPEISVAETLAASDLTHAQRYRIRIYGERLFDEGDTVDAGDPQKPTIVFRPDFTRDMERVWEEFIFSRHAVNATVRLLGAGVPTQKMRVEKMRIETGSLSDLRLALAAVGVRRPEEVKPDCVDGAVGHLPTRFAATVILASEV